ncbi:hypothetical protein LZ31DRAFT_485606, partial [Colletotrichum somersetense]
TNLWRLSAVRRGSYHLEIKELHDKYGPVVRIGPNTLDIDIPQLKTTIYDRWYQYGKTRFYRNNSTRVGSTIKYHMFSATDNSEHEAMRGPVASLFAMNSAMAFEPQMGIMIMKSCDILSDFAKTGKNFKLDKHIKYCKIDTESKLSSPQITNGTSFMGLERHSPIQRGLRLHGP